MYSSSEELLIQAIALILACLLLGFLWYRTLAKMGFEGTALWCLTVMAFFPPTALIEMFYLALFPWPIYKELNKLYKELRDLREFKRKMAGFAPPDSVDVEIDRLRGEMGFNQMKRKKKDDRTS